MRTRFHPTPARSPIGVNEALSRRGWKRAQGQELDPGDIQNAQSNLQAKPSSSAPGWRTSGGEGDRASFRKSDGIRPRFLPELRRRVQARHSLVIRTRSSPVDISRSIVCSPGSRSISWRLAPSGCGFAATCVWRRPASIRSSARPRVRPVRSFASSARAYLPPPGRTGAYIELRSRARVTEIIASPDNSGVAGVRFEDVRGAGGSLAADLVVDASGRISLTQGFLETIGWQQPSTVEIGMDQAYSTLTLEKPKDAPTDWLAVIHAPLRRRAAAMA